MSLRTNVLSSLAGAAVLWVTASRLASATSPSPEEMAWQFDCPETGEGLVQAFRREESPEASALPRLRGLDPNATYTLTNLDIAGATEMTRRELLETGLPISIPDRPGAVIIVYAKKEVPNNKKERRS